VTFLVVPESLSQIAIIIPPKRRHYLELIALAAVSSTMSTFMATTHLSSPFAEKIKGPNPATERGTGRNINSHPKEPLKIIYAAG
jgi:hypothetical protein